MRADVSAQVIFGVEDADVKLIDDEVIESGRTKARIMPGIVGGIAYNAIAVWIAVELKLARVWVALEAFTAGANHIEAIEITVFDARHKPSPEAGGILDEKMLRVFCKQSWRRPRLMLQDDVDLAR